MYDNEKVLRASDQRDIVRGGGRSCQIRAIWVCAAVKGMVRLKCLLFEETLASPV